MEQFSKVLKIRNLISDTDLQAERIIKIAINEYNIIPFVPLANKLRYYEQYVYSCSFLQKTIFKSKFIKLKFFDFWIKNMKKLSQEFYFGKPRKIRERISFSKKRFVKLLPKLREPEYSGNLSMIAEDMKSEMISKILIKDYENNFNHCILFDILSIRPLTFSEYISLFLRYPETEDFINTALGYSYEQLFNEIFEKNTKLTIPISIQPYVEDIYKIL